jgi:hypothetical protein
MQLKSFATEEDIRQHEDPLFLTNYPLSKLKMVSTIIFNESKYMERTPFDTYRTNDVHALGQVIEDAADEIDFLVNVAKDRLNKFESRGQAIEKCVDSASINPNSASFLSEISPSDAKTILEFMHLHLPGCKQLNPGMTLEESNAMGKLFDKVRAVLYCRARENQDQDQEVTL